MTEQEFILSLKELNIEVTEEQLRQFKKYYELLIEWNNKINLTRITDINQVYLKHFYDSATIVKVINLNNIDNLCDFGTGAGFPGIVLKILFPKLNITLVDSLNKRINFLNIVIDELNLKKITTIHMRVEDFAKENRNKYDLVVARAVSSLNVLLEYSIPMLKINKYFVALKANIDEELEESKNAINKLNTKLMKREEFNLPNAEGIRNILLFIKQKDNDKRYPRNSREIKEKPL